MGQGQRIGTWGYNGAPRAVESGEGERAHIEPLHAPRWLPCARAHVVPDPDLTPTPGVERSGTSKSKWRAATRWSNRIGWPHLLRAATAAAVRAADAEMGELGTAANLAGEASCGSGGSSAGLGSMISTGTGSSPAGEAETAAEWPLPDGCVQDGGERLNLEPLAEDALGCHQIQIGAPRLGAPDSPADTGATAGQRAIPARVRATESAAECHGGCVSRSRAERLSDGRVDALAHAPADADHRRRVEHRSRPGRLLVDESATERRHSRQAQRECPTAWASAATLGTAEECCCASEEAVAVPRNLDAPQPRLGQSVHVRRILSAETVVGKLGAERPRELLRGGGDVPQPRDLVPALSGSGHLSQQAQVGSDPPQSARERADRRGDRRTPAGSRIGPAREVSCGASLDELLGLFLQTHQLGLQFGLHAPEQRAREGDRGRATATSSRRTCRTGTDAPGRSGRLAPGCVWGVRPRRDQEHASRWASGPTGRGRRNILGPLEGGWHA
eukprot:scaffold1640_cov111-Isochrysis_galbana.AAC.16